MYQLIDSYGPITSRYFFGTLALSAIPSQKHKLCGLTFEGFIYWVTQSPLKKCTQKTTN